jgi:hypothetical protein
MILLARCSLLQAANQSWRFITQYWSSISSHKVLEKLGIATTKRLSVETEFSTERLAEHVIYHATLKRPKIEVRNSVK